MWPGHHSVSADYFSIAENSTNDFWSSISWKLIFSSLISTNTNGDQTHAKIRLVVLQIHSVDKSVDEILKSDHVAEKADHVADKHRREAAILELFENWLGWWSFETRAFCFLWKKARLGEENHRVGNCQAWWCDVRVKLEKILVFDIFWEYCYWETLAQKDIFAKWIFL